MSIVPSTTIITNLKTVTASTTNTLRSAGAGGVDMVGMLALALSKANELKACLTLLVRSTDGADPNLTTLNDILASLS
jgi:secreted protein with Ig-like and vWFA domain